jgi:hypothetical protein
MVETNINAYKVELEDAIFELEEAQKRVDELTDYIASRNVEVVSTEVKKGKK